MPTPSQILDRIEQTAHREPAEHRRPRNLVRTIPQLGHDTMRTRAAEMLLASAMCGSGAVLIAPGDTFTLDHWSVMREWIAIFPGSEAAFGALVLLVGLVRWVALFINGYWRRTPPLRIAGCIAGSFFWTSLALAMVFASYATLPLILALVLTNLAFEWFCAAKAAADAFYMGSFRRGGAPGGPRVVRDQ